MSKDADGKTVMGDIILVRAEEDKLQKGLDTMAEGALRWPLGVYHLQ